MSAKKVTLLFPGQGSQYVGMGKSLEGTEGFNVFEKANQTLGYSLSSLMFEGPEDKLTLTENTQPAILNHSIAHFINLEKILKKNNVEIERVLGHSVGEYAALVAAGVLSLEDATKAVHKRGQYMQAAVPAGKGKMFALLKVPEEMVLKACQAVSTDNEKVMPANFNEPTQIVISGEASACERAVKWLEENFQEAHRAVELNVSAPFHSSLMQPAAEKLELFLNQLNFQTNKISYTANIDARVYAAGSNPNLIKENLIHQVAGSVLWTQSIAALPDDTLCLEVGPGRVLMGLVRKINRNIKVISLDKEEAYQELEEALS